MTRGITFARDQFLFRAVVCLLNAPLQSGQPILALKHRTSIEGSVSPSLFSAVLIPLELC